MAALSIVIPHQGDSARLYELLHLLASWPVEIVVCVAALADPSKRPSDEHDADLADFLNARTPHAGRLVTSPPSRGGQIAAAIAAASGTWIWVIHSDSRPTHAALDWLFSLDPERPIWGRFDVFLTGKHPGLGLVAALMNWRSRATQICTGDQSMFFHRDLLARIEGFPAQPLMEDIEVSRRLRSSAPGAFRAPLIRLQSSGQRWDKQGWLRTIFRMWRFRWRYARGVSAATLFTEYYSK